jgi:thioredoxin 1
MANTDYAELELTRAQVDAMTGPVVVDFGTNWCGFCRAARPLIDAAFEAYPDIRHIRVEDGPGRALGRSFRVKLWPTLIFMRDGAEVSRLTRPEDSGSVEAALESIETDPGNEQSLPPNA